jgi:glycosyltransferase involved in cell wall biosynthesis
VNIDIKAKYVLQNNYIIYDQGVWVSKNIKRFLQAVKEVQKEIPLHVLFLGNTLSNHLETRQEIISLGIEKNCIFVWNPAENELQSYYTQSSWLFFPHLYDNFPSCVETALHFQTPIFISKWSETQLVLWDQAHYFSPLDTSSIQDALLQANSGVAKIQSEEILKKYDISNFAKHIFDTYTSIL